MDDRGAERRPDTGQDAGAAAPLSATAAAAELSVHGRTIRRAIAHGELAVAKRAGAYRIAPADLARYRASPPLEDLVPADHFYRCLERWQVAWSEATAIR